MIRVRAACHVHSDWSYDGKWSLQDLAGAFAGRRYRVVLVTEHDRGFDEARRLEHRAACQKASSESILLVPGIEYSDPTNTIHLLVWGDVPFIGCDTEPEQVLAAVQARGGVVVFAHPSRKEAWKRFKPEWKDGMLGIEFWNRKTDGLAPSNHAWPLLQLTGLVPFAGLDFHDSEHFFPLATTLELEPPVNEATVLAALRARRCHSKVLGMGASALADGLRPKALHSAEAVRKLAARCYRTFVPRTK
jgi:hypothetical protein